MSPAFIEVTVSIIRRRTAAAIAFGLPGALGITSHEVRAEVLLGDGGEPCVLYTDKGVVEDLGLDPNETAELYQRCVDAALREANRLAARKSLPDWARAG